MATTSPHTTWPLAGERSSLSSPSQPASSRWKDRLGAPLDHLYRFALARLLVRGLLKTPVTPSLVTAVQPVLAAVAGYLATFGDTRHLLIAAALFEARALLGVVDATLARARGAVTEEGRQERAGARGVSAAFLYASIAWHVHLHAPPALVQSAYLSAGVVGLVWMAASIALGGWLFAGSRKLAVA
jgi:hypothetical protein